ncbi:hypothetical protein ASD68_11180 [Rhodanobacter sp. Root627]|uniref:DUF262 domain-containing protein n=1 Tax=Rhodanobacter sp. Root627 TaxID=1736572 RepID=UPI0006FA7C3D|nr:DUF262 domain-containing protein [Rhodanobacter sp. Root627]KRA33534.1 hypothetical protein ASD68_11180 [Rhodanobacter sp. Root627]
MTTAPKIESSDLTIEQVYKDFYAVPDYQREYVWAEDDVQTFAEDIYDEFYTEKGELVPDSEYFIGSIVVCRNGQGTFDLIDGQQRMTTLFLFLCAIRDHLRTLGADASGSLDKMIADTRVAEDGTDARDYRLILQYEDSRDILERIADGRVPTSAAQTDTTSMRCIIDAYRVLTTFVVDEFSTNVAEVRKFFATLIRRVKLIRIVTPNLSHALKVFETVNDRGVGLTAMDLLKNLLFMRAAASDYPKLKDAWKRLTGDLDACKEKHLRFLRYFVMATSPAFRMKSGKPLREDEIYEWFTAHAGDSDLNIEGRPLAFLEKLVNAAAQYRRFAEGKASDGTPIRYLDNIQSLSGKARQHFILMLAGRHLPTDALDTLAQQLECLFFVYTVTREPTKAFEGVFGDWAADLRRARGREDVEAMIALRVRPLLQAKSSDFDFAMGALTASRIQKYRLKYVLAKLAQYLEHVAYQGALASADLATYLDGKLEIEHILPQNPGAALRASFDKPDDYDQWVERLGNLTLLEKPLNPAAGNKDFDEKLKAFAQSKVLLTRVIDSMDGYGKDTTLKRALELLSSYSSWNSETIEDRQKQLAGLARKVWLLDG